MKASARTRDFSPRRMVGAGVMGGDIATGALRGMTVTLQDQSVERIAPAHRPRRQLFERRQGRRRQARFALDRLIPDPGARVRRAPT